MGRTTIDYGIDLGTTNSEIAVFTGAKPEIIPSYRERSVVTPSAVCIDKKGQLFVGERARNRYHEDPENGDIEFKRRMGQRTPKRFVSTGREMLPEELSAEILKSLRADVRQYNGEDMQAVVITVPADFDLPQCEATKKAADLAGFSYVQLLQEPVAAALAYGFQSFSDRVFWLVYDFGGGTFDAAVIQVRDGVIQVVNHAGDNELGGKNIDWDIVNTRLIPTLVKQYKLSNFQWSNTGIGKWNPPIAKLKKAAEEAKISVSNSGKPHVIFFDDALCVDEAGQQVFIEYTLTPEELDSVAAPYIARSVNLCKKALEEKRLAPSNVQKVIMVGGASLLPSFRARVERELGIRLEFSIDPITVVAQGAAIFAGTQRLAPSAPASATAGVYGIDLEYMPVGNETDPRIGGRVMHPQSGNLKGYSVEFVEAKTQWRSGKHPLGDNGAFLVEIHAEKGRKCEFLIELCDVRGMLCKTAPDRISYTIGVVITNAPLTHSIGVDMANGEVDVFFVKGQALPCHQMKVHHTVSGVRKGSETDALRIPIVEGPHRKAGRNKRIGEMTILGNDPRLKRDIPAGSDVEITLKVDESRLVTAKAFIPVIDEELDQVKDLKVNDLPVADLEKMLEEQTKRLGEVSEKAAGVSEANAQNALNRIEDENIVGQVQSLLQAARSDSSSAIDCEHRLLALAAAIDDVEDAIKVPTLVEEAQTIQRSAQEIVSQNGTAEEKHGLGLLKGELEKVITSRDPDLIRQRMEAVSGLSFQVLIRQPGFWVGYLQYLEEQKTIMRDSAMADQLIAQGNRAIANQDIEALKAAVRQLIGLLPTAQQGIARGYDGTTVKK